MSMPVIDLEDIEPREALAAIMASIALQEAAVAHVLNAEGEKIQAVVNLEDATLEELQGINESVSGLVDSVSSLAGEIQRKLRTAMEALYPGELPEIAATLTVRIIDEGGNPVNAAGAEFTLISNTNPAVQFTSFPVGSAVRVNNVPPGLYTLQQTNPADGHVIDPDPHCVEVLSDGSIRFDGADAAIH
ncbi:MAG: prealbumin-like fold domain-containing protein, partial [Firmicutes bacterium]|nr:prealbumin-like fold domain-containing protein [Bacillota bacterium]